MKVAARSTACESCDTCKLSTSGAWISVTPCRPPRGVPARLLLYPEDSHPIDRPTSEADHWINVAHWLNEHLK